MKYFCAENCHNLAISCHQMDQIFSQIINSYSLELDNPFSRIAICSLDFNHTLSWFAFRSLDVNIQQFKVTNCKPDFLIGRTELIILGKYY